VLALKKRMLALVLVVCVLLCGCTPLVEDDEILEIYASFFPIYAFLDALTEDVPDINAHCLVQPQDGCLRDYQLSDWDLYLLASSADAMFMGGRGLESFEGTLFGWGEQGPVISAILYNLDLYNQDEEAVGEDASHFDGPNPHLYMSVNGAKTMLESMEATIAAIDPGYAHLYSRNLEDAIKGVEELQTIIEETRRAVEGSPVIIMNEALYYVADDYGLEIDMVFERESGVALYDSELDACIETIEASVSKVILIEKQAPQVFVKALENAGYTVVRIDILSDHRESEGFGGYIEAQKNNAAAIRGAFTNN